MPCTLEAVFAVGTRLSASRLCHKTLVATEDVIIRHAERAGSKGTPL